MQTNKNLIPSGLYDIPLPFYRVEFIDDLDLEAISFDMDLAKNHFKEYWDKSSITEDDIDVIVEHELYSRVARYDNYYRVLDYDYNEENAYKCNLIPFEIIDKYYLAYGGGFVGDISPNLDAYYFLQTGNMDPSSMYFSDKDYFKSLVSEEIFNAIEAKFGGVK